MWLYTSAGVISGTAAAGLHGNIGTVRTVLGGVTYASSDPAWYLGVAPAVAIVKATNAADPFHPTALEDGNDTAHELSLAIGTPVIWTYLVTNPGLVAVRVGSITDDRGTLSTADDFHPAYVSGDSNGNSLLDPGETWCFVATGIVTAGAYRNTATVSASQPGQPTPRLTATDVAYLTGTTAGINVRKFINGVAAQSAEAAVRLAAGSTATFTYQVASTTSASLGDVAIVDDNGTPNNLADDVVPTYLSGDVDGDGLLDAGEVWLFSAPHLVPIGDYNNVVRVHGDLTLETGAVTVWDDDINYSFGVAAATITVVKAVNALDPWHPTTIEDANGASVKELLAGTTAVWTYLVTNTGPSPLAFTSLQDDNGTPTNTADDFAPVAVLVTWEGATYNAGDLNHNAAIDPGETWLFRAETTVHLGVYRNTAAAAATELVTGQVATDSDIAGYYGNARGEGLTPGYWKNHTTLWPAGSNGTPVFSPDQLLTSVFTGVPAARSGETLLEALSAGGGGVIALFRAAVSGLLATTSQYISYPQSSTWLIASVNAALASGDAARISTLMKTLDGWNNYEADLTPPTVPASITSSDDQAVVADSLEADNTPQESSVAGETTPAEPEKKHGNSAAAKGDRP